MERSQRNKGVFGEQQETQKWCHRGRGKVLRFPRISKHIRVNKNARKAKFESARDDSLSELLSHPDHTREANNIANLHISFIPAEGCNGKG